jgi:transposase
MKQSKNSLAVHPLGVISALGIDVSKLTLDACMITTDSITRHRVGNDREGHRQLHAWARAISPEYCACLESTGSYGEAVAKYLFSEQVAVSLVNPAQTAAFAKAQLLRTKTDKVDAESIARFARAMLLEGQLPRYESRSEDEDALQELVRHRDALVTQRQQVVNRNGDAEHAAIKRSNQKLIDTIDREIKQIESEIRQLIGKQERLKLQFDLLTSIPGVGPVTASTVLAELPAIERFSRPNQVAAYAGLTPRTRHSGGRTPLSQPITKTGNQRLRKTLYMAAMVAIRVNPMMKQFAARLYQKGKAPKKVIVAIMRKMTHLIYAILRQEIPFNPNHIKNIAVSN